MNKVKILFVEHTSRIKAVQLSNVGQEPFLTHIFQNSLFTCFLFAVFAKR